MGDFVQKLFISREKCEKATKKKLKEELKRCCKGDFKKVEKFRRSIFQQFCEFHSANNSLHQTFAFPLYLLALAMFIHLNIFPYLLMSYFYSDFSFPVQ